VLVPGVELDHLIIINNDTGKTNPDKNEIARSVLDSCPRSHARKGIPKYREVNQAQYDKAINHKHTQALAHERDRQSQENSSEMEISVADKSSTEMIPITPKRTNNDRARRIMIVDDERDVTFLFKIILENTLEDGSCSCKVDSFNDSMTALENFREGLFDLIIIDIVMPRMDGFKLYKEMRKRDKIVKVCFLTAGEMYYEEYRKRAFPEISADRIIRKPISNDDLVRRVNSLLKA
jgi:CheY-like chemotaxis protein